MHKSDSALNSIRSQSVQLLEGWTNEIPTFTVTQHVMDCVIYGVRCMKKTIDLQK